LNLRLSFGRLWLLLAVALPVLGSLVTPLSTVDLAYHVRVGEEILDTGRIPATDDLTFTAAGRPWTDQQWLAQLVLGTLHRFAGWEGLAVLRAILVGLVFGLLAFAARAIGVDRRTAAWLSLAAFVVAVATLALRPQLLAMVLFALALALVAVRRDRPVLLWLLPFIAAVWANVHGSFVLAPSLAIVTWLSDLLERDRPARHSGLVAGATLAATLVTPFGFGVWGYAVGLTTNPLVTSRITEWQPTSLRTFTGLGFFVSAGLVALYVARRPARTPWVVLGWLGLLFVLGAYAERGVAWWPLGAVVTMAGLIAQDRLGVGLRQVDDDRPRLANGLIAVALAVVAVGLLPWWRAPDPLTGRRDLLEEAPSLTLAVREHTTPGDRLFVPQRWGSWFEWATPDRPVFVDSRVELFPVEVWDDATSIAVGLVGWQEVLDRWQVDAVVVDAVSSDLGNRLSGAGWKPLASDPSGRLFVRP
jgi:hypothetical protein